MLCNFIPALGQQAGREAIICLSLLKKSRRQVTVAYGLTCTPGRREGEGRIDRRRKGGREAFFNLLALSGHIESE